MLVEIALYKVIPGKEAQALTILDEQAALKRRLEGCRDARVLSGSRSVASPSTDPELILTLAEFDDAQAYASFRDLVAGDEKKAGKAALLGLTAAPPMVAVFE